MIFITKLELNNFQSHENSTIEFDRGLNVILGNSDSGKTAVLRAIKWALYNEPLGNYFIREGSKYVSVSVYFNTGAIVRRYRSASKNTYYLKKFNGEEFTFDGFGIDVPKEIKEEIGMYKINLDNKETSIINISEQLEGPFLLNEKSSLRASAIGRLIGVNYVDDALRDTVRDNKTINSDIKLLNINKEELTEELKKFEYIDEYEIKLKKLSLINSEITKMQKKVEIVTSLRNQYLNSNKEIDNINKTLKKYKYIDKLNDIYIKINSNLSKYTIYLNAFNRLNNSNKNIVLNMKLIDSLDYVSKLEEITLRLDENISKYSLNYSQRKRYENINSSINLDRDIVTKFKDIDQIYLIKNTLSEKILKYQVIVSYREKYVSNSKSLSVGENYLLKFKNLNSLVEIKNSINSKLSLYEKLERMNLNYNNSKNEIKNLQNKVEFYKYSLKEKTDEYNNVLLNLGYCPLCHSKIDKDTLDHIKEHYEV
ncbi:AAA domain-containing protein [Anaerosphaera aminiphila DSM 21120]|uniref:Nuclease SbcCD subunit C n=1 Tax=Anaerosphaera aminiphila DSM 21120 TaxID=1120995 RepID=A0A1M5NY01_9FIRM|nr:AAA family ATPase [Anaerosphaera aminiphila]SHG94347.1 AAA domain-containing protein [Anaerosphaera aminiphila DSM 21120]